MGDFGVRFPPKSRQIWRVVAYFRKHGNGWQASIERRGVRRAQTFVSKAAAVAWAGRVESEIMAGVRGEIPNLTLKDLFDRYEKRVSKKKKGKRWEVVRLGLLGRDRIALMRLRQLDTPHVADWQERRLEAVSEASVRRERNLLNNVFNVAVDEWHWLTKNPFKGVKRPKDGKPRERLATQVEIAKLTAKPGTLSDVIEWALETGTRAGEIASLKEIRGRIARVDGKTGERDVPLSPRALELWREGGFGLTSGSISSLFAERCKELGIEGLTFHDLRHSAATRLSKKLDAWELCKMFGWKDPRIALNTYYKADIEDMADKLS